MSETNNNTPMRITQLEEATDYVEGMVFPIAKPGSGTFQIDAYMTYFGKRQTNPLMKDSTFYTNNTNNTSFYISNRIIPSGATISKFKIYVEAATYGTIYIVSNEDKKVLYKKFYLFESGTSEINLNYKVAEDVVIGIEDCQLRYSIWGSDANTCFNDGGGLYEASPKNPEVGDTLTVTKTSTNNFSFSVAWEFLEGTISDIINELSDVEKKVDGDLYLAPSLASDVASYAYTSVSSDLYVSNRIIPQDKTITEFKCYSDSTISGFIYILDAETKEVLKKISESFQSGWNTFSINYYTKTNVLIGIRSTGIKFFYGSTAIPYELNKGGGLYQATNATRNAEEGQIVEIINSAPSSFAFALQWTYTDGLIPDVEYLKSEVLRIDNKLQNISPVLFDLSNFLTPRYKEIESDYGLVGRWWKYNGYDCTNNDGSEIYFKTNGTSEVSVNISQITVQEVTPYIAYSIDGGDFVRQQISTPNITLPDDSEHIIRIVIDGMTEGTGQKWQKTLGVYITSVESNNGTIKGLYPMNKIIAFYGDSITEGINALGTGANANVNSAVNSYPFACCNALNAISYRVGYGATGILSNGSFKPCIDAIDWFNKDDFVPTNYPDIIVINHGTNDQGKTDAAFEEGYIQVLDRMRIKYPGVSIICTTPFNFGNKNTVIKSVAERTKGCYFIDTHLYGGETVDGAHLSANGAKVNGEKLARDIINIFGKEYFI
jgi:lysophospholipase L1-like esterase